MDIRKRVPEVQQGPQTCRRRGVRGPAKSGVGWAPAFTSALPLSSAHLEGVLDVPEEESRNHGHSAQTSYTDVRCKLRIRTSHPHPAPCKSSPQASPPHHHACRWLSKCQLGGKYHRAEPSGGPSLDLALGTHSPPRCSPSGSLGSENKQRQRPPGFSASCCLHRRILFKNHLHASFPFQGRQAGLWKGVCLMKGRDVSRVRNPRPRGDPRGPRQVAHGLLHLEGMRVPHSGTELRASPSLSQSPMCGRHAGGWHLDEGPCGDPPEAPRTSRALS